MGRRKINRKRKLKIRKEGGVNVPAGGHRDRRKRPRDRIEPPGRSDALKSLFKDKSADGGDDRDLRKRRREVQKEFRGGNVIQSEDSFLKELGLGNESTDDETEDPIIQPAPYIIVVHGPPKVGKSLLIKSLVKYYTKHDVADIAGPITVVAGEQRRIQFVECPNNVNGMIDAAKYADAVIFVMDVSFGYEMETLEFVNLLKAHGMPMVMGVFTHFDCLLNQKGDDETRIRHFRKDFWNEIYEGAKIFCVSAPGDKTYPDHVIGELASFISSMEFHPLPSRAAHPYVLVDRFEDVTPELNENCNRDIIFYGYLRGCDIKKGTMVHIAGIHDFPLADITSIGETPPVLGETPPVRDVDGKNMKMQISINEDRVLPQETRFKKEIFRIGSYLMLKVCNVPSEMVNYHDPCPPILIGGINPEGDFNGSISARFETHSLHTKSLKARDPIIVSIGWRRYQTSPLYAQEDLREILEFTPEDKPYSATFWGPFATYGTEVVAVQSLADNKAAFRILATGEVIGFSRSPCLSVKRLGTPSFIISKTALIKDMFSSDFEINQYKDVTVKTVSGILGKVNEAATKEFLSTLKWKNGQPRQGIAKCTFDRQILLSDAVYMETLYDVPNTYSPLTTFLEPSNRVWADGTKESEKSEAHLVWASCERKLAPESVRLMMSQLLEQKLKFPCQRRKTDEQRRGVIIVHRLTNSRAAEFREAYFKQKVEDVLNNKRRGIVSRFVKEKPKKKLKKKARR